MADRITLGDVDKTLCDACRAGDMTAVRDLVDKGADVNGKDKYEQTPLQLATWKGHIDIVRYLHEVGADVNQAGENGVTPLHIAGHEGHIDIVQYLHDKGANVNQAKKNGVTPLYIAVHEGHIDIVQYLHDKGADVNQADKNGVTPLYIAAQERHIDIVQYLHDKGADVNQANKDGVTPLYIAAQKGHIDIVQYLHDKGADVNQAKKNGGTPLHVAAQLGHIDIVRYLLDKGADVNQADRNGITILEVACYNVAMFLVRAGPDPTVLPDARNHLTPAQRALLVEARENYNRVHRPQMEVAATPPEISTVGPITLADEAMDHVKDRLLRNACSRGDITAVRDLVDRGADVNGKAEDGWTPLQLAILEGRIDIVQYLCDKDADVNQANKDGLTPLYISVQEGRLDIVQILHDKGVDVNQAEKYGSTPLDVACNSNKFDIAIILVKAGADPTAIPEVRNYFTRDQRTKLVEAWGHYNRVHRPQTEVAATPPEVSTVGPITPADEAMNHVNDHEVPRALSADHYAAYERALAHGSLPDNTLKAVFLGDARVGKTSTVKSLSGKPFDPKEPITDGAEEGTLEIGKFASGAEQEPMSRYDRLARHIAMSTVTYPSREPSPQMRIPDDDGYVTAESASDDDGDELIGESASDDNYEDGSEQGTTNNASSATNAVGRTMDRMRDNIVVQGEAGDDQTVVFRTYDGGGQEIYQWIHHLFLIRSLCVCVLVFDLSKLLDEKTLGRLRYWINSAHSRAPTSPIFLVGTHGDIFANSRDDGSGTRPEILADLSKTILDGVPEGIKDFLVPLEYGKGDQLVFVVDNTRVDDEKGILNSGTLSILWSDYPEDLQDKLRQLMIRFDLMSPIRPDDMNGATSHPQSQGSGANVSDTTIHDEVMIVFPLLPDCPLDQKAWQSQTTDLFFSFKFEFLPFGVYLRFVARLFALHKHSTRDVLESRYRACMVRESGVYAFRHRSGQCSRFRVVYVANDHSIRVTAARTCPSVNELLQALEAELSSVVSLWWSEGTGTNHHDIMLLCKHCCQFDLLWKDVNCKAIAKKAICTGTTCGRRVVADDAAVFGDNQDEQKAGTPGAQSPIENQTHLGVHPLRNLFDTGRAVARVMEKGEQIGTAVLVAPNLVLTNWHVVDARAGYDAETAVVTTPSPLEDVQATLATSSLHFAWYDPGEPRKIVRGYPASDRPIVACDRNVVRLDYALVRLKENAPFSPLSLPRACPPSLKGPLAPLKPECYVLGFPSHLNQPQRSNMGACHTLGLGDINKARDTLLTYKVVTYPGNSGSPVLDEKDEWIGLHHGNVSLPGASVLRVRDGRGQLISKEANEGVRIDCIVSDILKEMSDTMLWGWMEQPSSSSSSSSTSPSSSSFSSSSSTSLSSLGSETMDVSEGK